MLCLAHKISHALASHMPITARRTVWTFFFPEKPVAFVHALFGAIFSAEPDWPLPMQVADHYVIDVTPSNGDFVDPRRLRTGLGSALELHPHIAHLRALHLAAPTAGHVLHFRIQVNPVRASGQIPHPSLRAIVPASVSRATCAADRPFSERPRRPTARGGYRTVPAPWLLDESRGMCMHRSANALCELFASGHHAKFELPAKPSGPGNLEVCASSGRALYPH